MPAQVEVVVIGGGQAGLAIGYYLTQQGRTHVVLEGVVYFRCDDARLAVRLAYLKPWSSLSHALPREPAYAVWSPLPADVYPRPGRAGA
jgi:cation diffusion facilitator CzcD-associated flavoprotein CzcO